MTKPEGNHQDVWDIVENIRTQPFHWKGPEEVADIVAKAIMAAKAEEREACAAMFEKHPFHYMVSVAIRNRDTANQ